jgi:S-adenosylmethionine decarboxylase
VKKLGRHLIVELYGCDVEKLIDADMIRSHMVMAAEISGATVVGEKFHTFNPHGVSGVVVLAESHFSIHTWPEYNYAAIDCFTCGDHCNPRKGCDYLKKALLATDESITELPRGLPSGENKISAAS